VTLFLLPLFGHQIEVASIVSCFLYLGNYYPPSLDLYWAHSWSLAIEEQFYIFWPLLMKFFSSRKKVIILAIVIILATPFSRVATYYFLPVYKHKYPFLLHTRIDSLIFGCLFALIQNSDLMLKYLDLIKRKSALTISVVYLFIVYPYLNYLFLGKFRATVGYTLESIFVWIMVVHLIHAQGRWYFKILNSKLFIHLGSISYGIYLWQQPITYLYPKTSLGIDLLKCLVIYLLAMTSYLLIEAPFIGFDGRKITHLKAF
jgi:peptidoglycan/LPS O-acetylase OafA/YrhL